MGAWTWRVGYLSNQLWKSTYVRRVQNAMPCMPVWDTSKITTRQGRTERVREAGARIDVWRRKKNGTRYSVKWL